MPENSRNKFRYKKWVFQPIAREPRSYEFDCDNERVSRFFTEDIFRYEDLRLCKTYELMTDETEVEDLPPMAFVSYCNDSIKISKMIKELVELDEAKPLKFYPAAKICWLGVSKHFQGQGLGTDLIDITKLLFASEENRTGCRILTVDAQNTERALALYSKTKFIYFNPNKTTENPSSAKDDYFPMFFDLTGPWEYDPDLLEPIGR